MAQAHRQILLVLGAVVAAAGFHDLARAHDGFRLWDGPPAGHAVHPIELTFLLWYLVFGAVIAGCLTLAAIDAPDVADRLEARFRRAAASPWLVPLAALVVLASALAVKDLVLASAPVSDDESVYVFIAKTLAQGRVVNTPPQVSAADLGYFRTSFVVLEESAWFGKYPIGHPLLLAAGELLGARVVVGPLLAASTVLVSWALARRLLGSTGAALTAALLVISPQLVFTAATEHAQNTSQLAMVLAVLLLLRARAARGRARWRELLLAGAALGFGVLARPMPGLPFAAAAAIWVLGWWDEERLFERLRALALGGLVLGAFGAVFGWVNWRQTGDAFVSGYQAAHGRVPGVDQGPQGIFTASFASAALRQCVWAFGWPLSFVFLPFARRRGASGESLAPVWLFLAASYAYRFIAPKVFVGTTGPIYVAEAVPLLAILTAAGMLRLRAELGAIRPSWSRAVVGLAVGSTLASVVLFLPFQIGWLERIAAPHRFTPDLLTLRGVQRAIVFSTNIPAEPGEGWAMWPPPPSPSLDEAVLYVRQKKVAEANVAFWKKHFPDRAAFVLELVEGRRVLRPLAPGSERPLTADRR